MNFKNQRHQFMGNFAARKSHDQRLHSHWESLIFRIFINVFWFCLHFLVIRSEREGINEKINGLFHLLTPFSNNPTICHVKITQIGLEKFELKRWSTRVKPYFTDKTVTLLFFHTFHLSFILIIIQIHHLRVMQFETFIHD